MTISQSKSLFPFITLALALASPGCNDKRPDAARETPPAPVDAPPSLASAHAAYLAGDFLEMGERLKEVLLDPQTGELARDNAYGLLESGYEAANGQLPSRAALPKTVSTMTLGVINGSTPYGPHRLVFLFMRVPDGRAGHITDVRVMRLPSESILGLVDKRGVYKVEHTTPGFEDVKLELRDVEVLPDRGVFSIQIVFDDGPGFDSFVLANKLVASAQPEITSPSTGQVLRTARPELAWLPYRSPELASWEARALSIGVTRDSTKASVLSSYQRPPGEVASAQPSAALEPDGYWMNVMYSEERRFGGIWLARSSTAARPFSVVR